MTETVRQRRVLFGLNIDALTMEESVALAEEALTARHRMLVGVVNAAKVVKLKTDAFLRDSLLDCDVLLADGQSVVWASRLLGRPLPERVPGIDLFEALLDLADEHGYGVYFLGAKPEVLRTMLAVVSERWPGVRIAGSRDGYYPREQSGEVAANIRASGADMLFLGITTPTKETFLAAYGDELGVPVLHGVGGSFDILAGVTQRAPERWQRWGLEWAYRVLQEPRRLWKRYLVTNLAFVMLLLAERIHHRKPYKLTTPTNGGPHG
jgi:N-acetylglucosaminyldiphosphoundecaprenol N-acetyl-beta-D-mannosaminyltransferase